MSLSLKSLDRICLLTVIVVLGLGGLWVLKQGAGQKSRISQENALYARSATSLNMAESNLQQLRTVLAATQNELTALKGRIPKAADIGGFLKQLDGLIKRRNMVLITLQPLPEVKASYFAKIPIRLTVRGAFGDMCYLLYDLETMDRMLVAEKITISNDGIDEQCRIDLTLNIFGR